MAKGGKAAGPGALRGWGRALEPMGLEGKSTDLGDWCVPTPHFFRGKVPGERVLWEGFPIVSPRQVPCTVLGWHRGRPSCACDQPLSHPHLHFYVQPSPFVSFPGKVLNFGTPSFTLSPPCSSVPCPGGGRGFLASCSCLAPVKPKWFPSPRAVPVPGAGAPALGWIRELLEGRSYWN